MHPHALSIALALALVAAPTLHAQTLELQPSGRARTEVTLVAPRGTDAAPAKIALDYGQPHLRGRTLHTGNLVPYGTPWRTGANELTTFTTDVDLTIGGQQVPRGRYVVYTLPTRDAWTLILQREAGQNPMQHDPSLDAARIPLRVRQLPMPIESLTMWLIPSTEPGAPKGELRILWGNTEVATDWAVR